jgi:hypothetical protein
LTEKISKIRAGELGGGSLASQKSFSWSAAAVGVVITLLLAVLLKLRGPTWIRKRLIGNHASNVEQPDIEFYAQTLDQLARVGISRRAEQTPVELADEAERRLRRPDVTSIAGPLGVLTSAFYKIRFGTAAKADDGLAEIPPMLGQDIDQALQQLTGNVDLIESATVKGGRGS